MHKLLEVISKAQLELITSVIITIIRDMTGRMNIIYQDEIYSLLSLLLSVCGIGPIYHGERMRHGGSGTDISWRSYRILRGGSWLAKSIDLPHFLHFCLLDGFVKEQLLHFPQMSHLQPVICYCSGHYPLLELPIGG